MLYHLHEFQKAAAFPAHQWSEATGLFLDALALNNSPVGRYLTASNEMLERATRDFKKPEFGLQTFAYIKNGKTHKGYVCEEVVIDLPFCNLLHFKRENDEHHLFGGHHPKVLLVAPLSGHYATLLRDTVRTFLPHHDVWIVDWKDARDIPVSEGAFSLDDYAETLLKFFDFFHGHVHVVAVCQPVVPVLMAISHMAFTESPNQPRTMTLMGGPVDARVNPGRVNDFGREHSLDWFKNNIVDSVPMYYKGANRLVCPGFIMLDGFMALNIERHSDASRKLFQHLVHGDLEPAENHRLFYDEYRSVMDVPAEYYLQSIEKVFQKFDLPCGKMTFKGRKIQPELIRKTALLTIEGEKDDISCVGQTYAAQDLCKNLSLDQRDHYVQKDVGHYGIFNGRRFREFIYPRISAFIRRFETKEVR